jgi:hypothetical protein
MKIQPSQKQWWAPVWKGLVMDAEAKHYRTMKAAVWLYLYLLLNANRQTGILMRKLETVSRDMGVTRDTALRWLNVLRRGGYVETVNTGRSLVIQLTRWKPLAGAGSTRLQKPAVPNFRYGERPGSRIDAVPGILPGIHPVPSVGAASNDTKKQKDIINDGYRHAAYKSREPGFTAIGPGAQRMLLAQELASRLNDPAGISLYRSYAGKYPESLLREVLADVEALPPEYFTKGRGALFNYLVQHYAKGTTENPGG